MIGLNCPDLRSKPFPRTSLEVFYNGAVHVANNIRKRLCGIHDGGERKAAREFAILVPLSHDLVKGNFPFSGPQYIRRGIEKNHHIRMRNETRGQSKQPLRSAISNPLAVDQKIVDITIENNQL